MFECKRQRDLYGISFKVTEQEARNLIASLAWDADDNDCWIWRGRLNANDQPVITVDGETEIAARFAYRTWRDQGHEMDGELEPFVPLVPRCGNRLCVCPFHFSVGDPQGSPRGRHNRSKTHCRWGHPYSGDNLGVRSDGRRRCLTCHAVQSRQSRLRCKARRRVQEEATEEILEDLQRPFWEDNGVW